MHGINFLVLAIGIYGIGEMLWTIEEHRKAGGQEHDVRKATVTIKRTLEKSEGAAGNLEDHD